MHRNVRRAVLNVHVVLDVDRFGDRFANVTHVGATLGRFERRVAAVRSRYRQLVFSARHVRRRPRLGRRQRSAGQGEQVRLFRHLQKCSVVHKFITVQAQISQQKPTQKR